MSRLLCSTAKLAAVVRVGSKPEPLVNARMSAFTSCGHACRMAWAALCHFQTLSWCSNTSGQRPDYSITSSARASSIGGTSMPIALAALMLITSSNLVGN